MGCLPRLRTDSGTRFFPTTTRKAGGLITKSETYAHKVALNDVILDMAGKVLTQRNRMRLDKEPKWSTSLPQVNVTGILEIHPGDEAQTLHRDDFIFHRTRPRAVDEWTPGHDVSNFPCPSHLWHDDHEPHYEDALKAEMEIGDVFIMLCSTYHGGGSNVCEPGSHDSVRTIAAYGMTLGTLRQEETQYLALAHEKVKKLPIRLQQLAGWNISFPMLGWVEYGHPLNTLGHSVPESDELFFDKNQSD